MQGGSKVEHVAAARKPRFAPKNVIDKIPAAEEHPTRTKTYRDLLRDIVVIKKEMAFSEIARHFQKRNAQRFPYICAGHLLKIHI